MVQWLRFHPFNAGAWVQSLVSSMCGRVRPKKKNKEKKQRKKRKKNGLNQYFVN